MSSGPLKSGFLPARLFEIVKTGGNIRGKTSIGVVVDDLAPTILKKWYVFV
jgi:hypothetical protein